MSNKNSVRKFLLSVILLLSIAIVAVYVFGVYFPEKAIIDKIPIQGTGEIRSQ